MIGVTLGIGKYWQQVAEISAREMERHTDLKCEVITEMPLREKWYYSHLSASSGWAGPPLVHHPSWLKLYVFDLFPEQDEILFFDADILCIKPWLVYPASKSFRICNDEHSLAVDQECRSFNIPGPWKYYNAGLWIAHRSHDPILKRAAERHPSYGSWLEQTALTTELQKEEVSIMDQKFNKLLWPGFHSYRNLHKMPEVNLHLASIGNPQHLLAIYKDNGL